MNRRRFLTGALGAGAVTLGTPWLATAQGATEDDLAFANFGASTEFLVKDFYAKALEAKLVSGPKAAALKRGRAAAGRHAKALSDLLTSAGDVAPLPEDFEFEWPADTFKTEKAMRRHRARGAAGAARRLPDRRCDGERSVLPRALREPRGKCRPADRRARRACLVRAVSDRDGPRGRERRARGVSGLGGEMRKRIAATRHRDPRGGSSRVRSTDADGASDHLRGRLADRRVQGVRRQPALQLRRLERARDPDPKRRAGGCLCVRGASQHPAAVQAGSRGQAGHVHLQQARAHRPQVESGGHPVDLRPQAQAREARGRRRGRTRSADTRARCCARWASPPSSPRS